VAYGSHDATWTPLYEERSSVRDNYKWGTLYLSKKDGSDYRLNVEVRAYDEGVAFLSVHCEFQLLFKIFRTAFQKSLRCINANIRMYRNDHLKMYKITL
jgi:hypothetical protein